MHIWKESLKMKSCGKGCRSMSNEMMTGHDIEALYKLAELFKIFGDSTRIRILDVLIKKELCVQDIADELSMTQSAISHQLRILKQSDLVRSRREGKAIFYSLADDHVTTIMNQGLEHVCDCFDHKHNK